jgi:hypothetical protein
MGILDDAIREHLELKRQHGVAEEELQRQEEEALGPARRDVAQQQHEVAEPTPGHPATAEDGDAAAPAAAEETALFDMERTDVAADEPHAAVEATPVEPPPVEPPPVEPDAPEADITADEPEPDEDDLLAAESEDEPLDDQVLEEEEEEAEDEDADVLEDTPDFLQETPEHDRLWFEQKPPRDFDFD